MIIDREASRCNERSERDSVGVGRIGRTIGDMESIRRSNSIGVQDQ